MADEVLEAALRLQTSDYTASLERVKGRSNETFGAIQRQVVGLAASFASVTAASRLVEASIDRAFRTERAVAEIRTLGGVSAVEGRRIRDELFDTSVALGQQFESLARARYDVISAGFRDIGDSALILDTGAKLAVAGLTDTATAVPPLLGLLKAYKLDASDAPRLGDLFFGVGVREGLTTVPELANAIGQVVPSAVAANVSVDELFAAMATGTVILGDTNRTATAMARAFEKSAAATKEQQAAARALGVDLEGFVRRRISFEELVRQVAERSDLSIGQLRPIFQEQEAIRGIQTLAAQVDSFTANIAKARTEAGSLDEGVSLIGETGAQSVARLKALGVELEATFGEALASHVTKANRALLEQRGLLTEISSLAGQFAGTAIDPTGVIAANPGLAILLKMAETQTFKGGRVGFQDIVSGLETVGSPFERSIFNGLELGGLLGVQTKYLFDVAKAAVAARDARLAISEPVRVPGINDSAAESFGPPPPPPPPPGPSAEEIAAGYRVSREATLQFQVALARLRGEQTDVAEAELAHLRVQDEVTKALAEGTITASQANAVLAESATILEQTARAGRNYADVLEEEAEAARDFAARQREMEDALQALRDQGLTPTEQAVRRHERELRRYEEALAQGVIDADAFAEAHARLEEQLRSSLLFAPGGPNATPGGPLSVDIARKPLGQKLQEGLDDATERLSVLGISDTLGQGIADGASRGLVEGIRTGSVDAAKILQDVLFGTLQSLTRDLLSAGIRTGLTALLPAGGGPSLAALFGLGAPGAASALAAEASAVGAGSAAAGGAAATEAATAATAEFAAQTQIATAAIAGAGLSASSLAVGGLGALAVATATGALIQQGYNAKQEASGQTIQSLTGKTDAASLTMADLATVVDNVTIAQDNFGETLQRSIDPLERLIGLLDGISPGRAAAGGSPTGGFLQGVSQIIGGGLSAVGDLFGFNAPAPARGGRDFILPPNGFRPVPGAGAEAPPARRSVTFNVTFQATTLDRDAVDRFVRAEVEPRLRDLAERTLTS